MEAADFLKVAVDSLAADEIPDPLERVQSLTADAQCGDLTVSRLELAKGRLDRGTYLPAVSRRTTPACILRIEDYNVPAPSCQFERSREPGISASDDRDIAIGGLRHKRIGRPWRRSPPIGLAFVIGCKKRIDQRAIRPQLIDLICSSPLLRATFCASVTSTNGGRWKVCEPFIWILNAYFIGPYPSTPVCRSFITFVIARYLS